MAFTLPSPSNEYEVFGVMLATKAEEEGRLEAQDVRRRGSRSPLLKTVVLTTLAFGAAVTVSHSSAPIASAIRSSAINVEGSPWAHKLYDSLLPTCPRTPTAEEGGLGRLTKMYDDPLPLPRTALATYPRSGNSWTRMLIERATGYRTTSVYCDHSLEDTFLGECAGVVPGSEFLMKTHYPAAHGDAQPGSRPESMMTWDRAVLIIRNPLDAVHSYWHYDNWDHSAQNGTSRHEWRGQVDGLLGSTQEQLAELRRLAGLWKEFHSFWEAMPIPRIAVRYEDMRQTPLPSLLSIVSFLLPTSIRPSLSSIACSLTNDPSREAYSSTKSPLFASWDKYTPEARQAVLEMTKEGWCRYGYDVDARNVLGRDAVAGVDCRAALQERITGLRPPPFVEASLR